jgi:hypothetical protein
MKRLLLVLFLVFSSCGFGHHLDPRPIQERWAVDWRGFEPYPAFWDDLALIEAQEPCPALRGGKITWMPWPFDCNNGAFAEPYWVVGCLPSLTLEHIYVSYNPDGITHTALVHEFADFLGVACGSWAFHSPEEDAWVAKVNAILDSPRTAAASR